jgi:hypothetical protein
MIERLILYILANTQTIDGWYIVCEARFLKIRYDQKGHCLIFF